MVYDQYIEQTPESFEGYKSKLLFVLLKDRFQDGVTTCNHCIELHPQWPEAYNEKSRMLRCLRQYDEALASIEVALQLDPDHPSFLLEKADALDDLNRSDESLALCEQALRLDPSNTSAHRMKGDLLARMKKYEDALPAYQKAAQLTPDNVSILELIGSTLSQLERYEEAAKTFTRALQISPETIRLYSSKVHALIKAGLYDKALATCDKGLQLNQKSFSLNLSRGRVLKKLLRYKEANDAFFKARLTSPDPIYELECMLSEVDLTKAAAAQERLQASGKEISDDAIEAEINLIYAEKKAAELKAALRASLLFEPICLLMQEQQGWSGTPKQFKEMLWARFPDAFAKWYKSPWKYTEELKKISPELQIEGIIAGIPPGTTLITLTRVVMNKENTIS